MKLFLDTANLDEIREAHRWGVLRGITTNPMLVTMEHRDFLPLVKEICSLVEGEVSVETASDDTDVLIRQAHDIRQIADNTIVKIVCTPNGLAATRKLADEEIKVNMTLVFSPAQALLAAEAGAYPLIISQRLLGTEEIVVIHHSDCGMLTFSNEELIAKIDQELGADASDWDFLPFTDLEASVLDDVDKLRHSPLIPTDIPIAGAIYDVESGKVKEVTRK